MINTKTNNYDKQNKQMSAINKNCPDDNSNKQTLELSSRLEANSI